MQDNLERRGLSVGVLGAMIPQGFSFRTQVGLAARSMLDVIDSDHGVHHLELTVRQMKDINSFISMMEGGFDTTLQGLIAQGVFLSVHAPGRRYGYSPKEDDTYIGPLREIFRAVPGMGPLVAHGEWFADMSALKLIQLWGIKTALEPGDFRFPEWNNLKAVSFMAKIAEGGIVGDLAHIASVDPSESALEKFVETVYESGGYLSHIHGAALWGRNSLRKPKHYHTTLANQPDDHPVKRQSQHFPLNGTPRMWEGALDKTLRSPSEKRDIASIESLATKVAYALVSEYAQISHPFVQ